MECTTQVADGVPVPPLLITGPPSTGKTSVVRAVLDYRGFSYVHVNCMEVVAKNNLFEAVIEQTAGSRYSVVTSTDPADIRNCACVCRCPLDSKL